MRVVGVGVGVCQILCYTNFRKIAFENTPTPLDADTNGLLFFWEGCEVVDGADGLPRSRGCVLGPGREDAFFAPVPGVRLTISIGRLGLAQAINVGKV